MNFKNQLTYFTIYFNGEQGIIIYSYNDRLSSIDYLIQEYIYMCIYIQGQKINNSMNKRDRNIFEGWLLLSVWLLVRQYVHHVRVSISISSK